MLVLTRKPDQSIMLGKEIEVTVLEVRGDQVRLGIRAPHQVTVHRKEVFEQIGLEKQNDLTVGGAAKPEFQEVIVSTLEARVPGTKAPR